MIGSLSWLAKGRRSFGTTDELVVVVLYWSTDSKFAVLGFVVPPIDGFLIEVITGLNRFETSGSTFGLVSFYSLSVELLSSTLEIGLNGTKPLMRFLRRLRFKVGS
jgi:hypothetical protein